MEKMPVRFKGGSEYATQYKPLQSYKSASFKPEAEQVAPFAGKESAKQAIIMEPPLQRKKRVSGPCSSLSLEGGLPEDDDYALLGQQEKFAHNVRYRPKKSHFLNGRDMSPPKQQKLMDEGNIKKKSSKSASSASAPKVDTSKFAEPPTPLAPRKPREERSSLVRQLEAEQNIDRKDNSMKPLRDKMTEKARKVDQSVEVRENLNNAAVPTKHKVVDKMNEFAQTNMEKKLTFSGPEAPADYALKYKTKIVPPRPGRKLSEYQKEFSWKKGFPASPLLDAEVAAKKKEVVYNSNEGVVQAKPDLIPKESEYQRQFKKWNQRVVAPTRSSEEPKKRQKKIQRSKSMSELHPEKMLAAGSAPVTSSDDKRLLRESHPKPATAVVLQQHGKLKRAATEYRSNYKAPLRFSYDHGAWKGADPPHLLQQKEAPAEAEGQTEAPPLSNWFAEVLELRRKAQEYKLRAQGTHFSREHLVQLMAQQNRCWDMESTRSSTLSALSLESGASPLPEKKTRERREESVSRRARERKSVDIAPAVSEPAASALRKQAWASEREESEVPDNKSVMTTEAVAGSDEENEVAETPPSESTLEGRIPTPKLRRQTTPPRRHHLDLTTPSVGGSILSSPPRPKKTPSAFSVDLSDASDPEPPQKHMTYNLNRLLTSPTLGHPTRDTHALRDDFALEDQPLSTQYLQSGHTTPVKRVEKAAARPMVSTLNENYGMTYNKRIPEILQGPVICDDDDDKASVLSDSIRSIASSCSVASELYERSKQRRDNFWKSSGKPLAAK